MTKSFDTILQLNKMSNHKKVDDDEDGAAEVAAMMK